MGLLDSDAEELKKNKTESSGRKVNQSGLGALRGLSKISNLTAKYRQTSEARPTENSVEQNRGTSPKSVQTGGERSTSEKIVSSNVPVKPSANMVQGATLNDRLSDSVMGAKSVHAHPPAPTSKSSVEVTSEVISDSDLSAKSVQPMQASSHAPEPEVNVVSTNEIVSPTVLEDLELNSVSGDVFKAKDLISPNNLTSEQLGAKSVQLPAADDLHRNRESLISAEISSSGNAAEKVLGSTNLVQTGGKIGADEVPSEQQQVISAPTLHQVQSEGKVGAVMPRQELETNSMRATAPGAKSVQTEGKVSAESSRLSGGKPSANKTTATSLTVSDLGAKSVREEVTSVSGSKSQGSLSSLDGMVGVLKEQSAKRGGLNSQEKLFERAPGEPESITSIGGTQRQLLEYFFELCQWANSLITPAISRSQIVAATGLKDETIISSVKRLVAKNVIYRDTYKDGKAGWTKYRLDDGIYKDLVHHRQLLLAGKLAQPTGPQQRRVAAEIVEKPAPTNTWFNHLDFTAVHPISSGVVNSGIKRVVQDKLTPEQVQDFLDRYTSWFVTQAQSQIGNPIGLFCRKLQEFALEGDSPVLTFLTEQERQVEAEFIAKAAKARAEINLIESARSEADRAASESTFQNSFETWLVSASESEKNGLYAASATAPMGSEVYLLSLRAMYREKVYDVNRPFTT